MLILIHPLLVYHGSKRGTFIVPLFRNYKGQTNFKINPKFIHGVLMFISWLFFAVIGILSIRYFKGKKFFYLIHAVFMTLATIITVIMFILILESY